MMGLALVAITFARQLVPLYNPAIHDPNNSIDATLTRIMLLQSIALGAGVIVSAVLNARQDFRLYRYWYSVIQRRPDRRALPGIYFAYRGQRNEL